MNQKLTIAIVAAGNGSRMEPLTAKQYPKILCTIGKKTMLEQILENCNFASDIYIICNETDKQILKAWIAKNYPRYKRTKFVVHNETNGSFNACLKFVEEVKEVNPKTGVLFHWSDITTPNLADIDFATFQNDNVIFVTKPGEYRCLYTFYSGPKDHMQLGNVPGLYYMPNASELMKYSSENFVDMFDFVKAVYGTKSYFRICPVQYVLDNGDMQKHSDIMLSHQKDIETRAFNSMKMTDTTVTKIALNEHGKKIQKYEANFYLNHPELCGTYFPKLISIKENELTIERLVDHVTLHEMLGYSFSDVCSVIEIICAAYDKLVSLHNTAPKQSIDWNNASIQKEFVESVDSRVTEVCDILHINQPILINNKSHGNPGKIFSKWIEYCKNKTFEFGVTHGDPNSCNIMIDDDLDVKFIDPRGYFGYNTQTGSIDYDIAKFVYGVHAYSAFNLSPVVEFEKIDENKYNFNMEYMCETCDLEFVFDTIGIKDEYREFIRCLVGIIFIKLTGYIKNDPTKSIIAYHYGYILLEQGLRNLKML